MSFFNSITVNASWMSFERMVCRFLVYDGFSGVRLVGQTNDKGADIIAHKAGKRWLVQVKHWKIPIGVDVLQQTLDASRYYQAQVPVVIALKGFQESAIKQRNVLLQNHIPMQLWSASDLIKRANGFSDTYPFGNPDEIFEKRDYQEEAIQLLIQECVISKVNRALIVMATGLGKTHVLFEFIRRFRLLKEVKVLFIAHTNALVAQLEQNMWTYLKSSEETLIWNGYEPQNYSSLSRASSVFACLNSVSSYIDNGFELPHFDIIAIDECHHVSDNGMYGRIIDNLKAGTDTGPKLIGVTATPWRQDQSDISAYFGDPLISIDMITGLKRGFLSNIEYRMYTDNIDWHSLKSLHGEKLSPRGINRTLFISNWDDAVVLELKKAWNSQDNPRSIVFCGIIDHAIMMRDKINALGFCRAEAIYSKLPNGKVMESSERNKILCDFHDGRIQVVCAVDIFNEGIDVPDVNIVVFQRVTHSRRIFIQQLGRGLRLSKGKKKVLVLDFVSDIRRFAAGISLKDSLKGKPAFVNIDHKVEFCKVGGSDEKAETFLREWLEDVAAIEDAQEDASILKFPPAYE
ncbi:MAG: DEAD/DEAH box helicase family protein [Fermentimonas sp.]|nr:DEAD/DEAH box helicase family protein [Fermentimonas sp.]